MTKKVILAYSIIGIVVTQNSNLGTLQLSHPSINTSMKLSRPSKMPFSKTSQFLNKPNQALANNKEEV